MAEDTIIDGDELRDVLAAAGVRPAGVFTLDSTYKLLTRDDVCKKLSESFTDVLDDLSYRYVPERNDCENFACFLWGWTAYWHSKQKRDASDNGVAFGFVCNAVLAHGFNFAIHQSDAGVLYPQAYEPQRDPRGYSCAPIDLTPDQWKGSFLCVC